MPPTSHRSPTARRRQAALAAAVAATVGAGLVPGGPATAADPSSGSATAAAETRAVTLRPNPAYQGEPFQGWGTSLVWFANATGDYPADVRQDLYEKVFGPDGLNLNIARYNVGGGNASDVAPYLNDGSAVEGWWQPVTEATADTPALSNLYGPDGRPSTAQKLAFLEQWNPEDPSSYDLTADHTQRWWVDELTRRDQITHWETFSNSPPWFMTRSGYVSGAVRPTNGTPGENLLPEAEEKFAAYMKHVTQYLEDAHGIEVSTVDPFNEPNTTYWGTDIDPATGRPPTTYTQKQEGAIIQPPAQNRLVQDLAAQLAQEGTTTDAVISAMDETNPGLFMTNWNAWTDASRATVGQLNVHTYGTNDRRRVRDLAKSTNLPMWMSEVEGSWGGNVALGDSPGGWDRSNIANGLGMAGRIIDDLRELEPGAWVFWQPVEDAYKMENGNGGWGSIYIDFDCNYPGREGMSNRRLNDGDSPDEARCKVLTNQKYNTVRNFTHYIRPGDRLVPTDDTKTVTALRADGTGATLVHYNDTATAETVTLDLSLFGDVAQGATVTPVVTTKSPIEDVERNALVEGRPVAVDAATKAATLTVPAGSVVTFLVDGVTGVAEGARPVVDGGEYLLRGDASRRFLTAGPSGALTIEDLRVAAGSGAPVAGQRWTAHAVPGPDAGADAGAGQNGHAQAYVLRDGDGRALVGAGGAAARGQGGTVTATALSVDEALADPAAHWVLTTEDGVRWRWVNRVAAVSLDVSSARTAAGSPVALWSSNGATNQVFAPMPSDAFDVVGVEPQEVSTLRGQPATLPTTATLRYRIGETAQAPVTWPAVDPAVWKKNGTHTLTGSGTDPFGRPYTGAPLTLVVGKITAADPVSVTVPAGTTAAEVRALAPAVVPVQVATSTHRLTRAVSWDLAGLTDAALAQPGTVAVTGTVTTPNDPVPARLSVVVVGQATSSHLCRDLAGASVTASFTEGGYAAARTCDGSAGTSWSNWVSAGRTADTLTYELGRPAVVSGVAITFAEKAPATAAVRYRDAAGQWVAVGTPATNPALGTPLTVALPSVRTTAVQVALTMSRSYTKVAEVAITGAVPAPSSEAGLGRLLVDGKDVASFSATTSTYTVDAPPSRTPVVAAVPLDEDATVVVEQATAANARTATVTVTAPDGTTERYTVTFRSS
ncbi:glycoside hydrolase [Cellulomonas marina]|uniref:Ig-like domain (Group 4) n=1 Tax=Cellulomonas marina TaxID=988821 RepID=A0A1I1AYB8_9CELL|nr:glycoside hydrolase [Cellulomonas marina]GIG30800.1 hypothetical protein Cma02nite_34000 [Cellulomonas marina]SFB42406.1 Ig-like domain (group 4) [Cellulomonas marina]